MLWSIALVQVKAWFERQIIVKANFQNVHSFEHLLEDFNPQFLRSKWTLYWKKYKFTLIPFSQVSNKHSKL